jgi:opacity protein-like surface antigen
MKNIVLAVFAMLLAHPALAGSYTGVYGGVNFDDVINAPFVDDNTGVVGGAVVGTDLKAVPGLRLEADLSFRQNDVDVGPISASHETTALMANVVYELPLAVKPIKPYVMVGVGYAATSATFESVGLLKLEASGLAYQAGAGVEVDVADGITAGLGYRYFQSEAIEVLGTELSDGSNHSLVASLRFAL